MKKFIKHFFCFIVLSIAFLVTIMFVLQFWLRSNKYYQLEKNTHTIIIGNSRPECSYNDSLIQGTRNLSLVAEPYFYTYIKLRKLLESNKDVKQVILEISDISLSNEKMNKWMFGTESVKYLYTKYANIMYPEEKKLILSQNPQAVIRSLSLPLHDNLLFITGENKSMLTYKKMGGFVAKSESHIDELRRTQDMNASKEAVGEIAKLNLLYLDKIVSICKQYHIKLLFLRSPVHPIYRLSSFDNVYESVLHNRYASTDLIDFANFALEDSEYFDAHHLNYKGARRVSATMDSLIKLMQAGKSTNLFRNHRLEITH